MIRTLVEIQGGRVSIRETAAETTVTVTVDGALSEPAAPVLYTAEQVGDFQASEAELVSAPLRRRIEELEKKLAEETQRADQNREWADRAEDRVMKDAQAHILRVRDLEAELTKAQERYARQSAAHDRVIKARDEECNRRVLARDRLLEEATQERDEREAARADLERKLIRRTEELGLVKNDRNRLAAKVRSARELLTTNEVIQARRMDGSRTGTTMGQAIESVLRALSPPEPDTSQA